jgi:glucose dehydrogenase
MIVPSRSVSDYPSRVEATSLDSGNIAGATAVASGVRLAPMPSRLLALSGVALLSCVSAESLHAQSEVVAVTDAMLQSPEADDWLMWRRTLDGWGYSPLDQIDRSNVADLKMVWSRGIADGSNQGTPLVYDGVM